VITHALCANGLSAGLSCLTDEQTCQRQMAVDVVYEHWGTYLQFGIAPS
jgi:hypothetical protein